MRARSTLHRLLCVLFVLASGSVHFVGEAPEGERGAWGIAIRMLMAIIMIGAWATSRDGTGEEYRWTLIAGAVARMLVAPLPVSGSHDVQRYIWDGAVFFSGMDPYRIAPAHPDASALRAVWPTPPEHASYSTIYPPGAVFLFGAAASIGPVWAPWVWKLFIVIASMGTLFLGARALKALDIPHHLPLLAFAPLLVMETAYGAHLDMFAALSVAGGLLLAVARRNVWAGIALGAGGLVKFLPLLVLLPLAARSDGRSARRMAAGALLVFSAGYCAAFLLGLRPVGSLPVFFEKWRFGSPMYSAVAAVLGDAHALRAAPLIAGAIVLAAIIAARWNWRRAVPIALTAPLIASPVVFPWYLLPLIPAVALAPSAFAIAWTTTISLTNEVYDNWQRAGVWEPASWPLWVIGATCVAGAAFDVIRARRNRHVAARAPVGAPRPRISVIIPVLNEEAVIGEQIRSLAAIEGLHEIIVVDGGSTDRTLEIVGTDGEVKVIASARGRAEQMNAGAQIATGDVLLFLHADVQLPRDAARWIERALVEPEVVSGAFRTWTVGGGKRSWLNQLLHLADLRSRYSCLPYGDQAPFVRAEVFRQIGCFPRQPLMEDIELSRRLRRVGRIRTVPVSVRVLGRRFLARPAYYTLLVNIFPWLYRAGMPPALLARLYGNPR